MVYLKNRSPIFDLNSFIEEFFHDWPEADTKPPMAVNPQYKDEEFIGAKIELAAAGYKEEDLKVSLDGDKLIISGDNTDRDISGRFKSKFQKKVFLQKTLDQSSISVTFEDGILSIFIPVKAVKSETKLLFGK